jgi:hypothetical protein
MMDVEIQWPDQADTGPLLDAAAQLREAGVDTECLVQPVRRGGGLETLVLVAVPALEPFLKALFEKVGADAYTALRGFVKKLLTHDETHKKASGKAPSAVVFESRETGAQFVFTPGLPEAAFHAALQVKARPDPGRWVWDTGAAAWLRLEDGSTGGKDG